MVNLILGAPLGRPGVRPYVSGGLGLIRSNVSSPEDLFDDISDNNLGVNVGAGVMGFFHDNVGLHGDVRVFRNMNDADDDDGIDFDLGSLTFWRASAGLTFRF
jgi:opacity protein-like surface antigen